MKQVGKVGRYISIVATVASILSPAFATVMPLWLRIVITILGVVCFVILMIDEHNNNVNERICSTHEEVNAAMKDIINSSGKICIVSRDLSWVNNDDIKECLIGKKENVLIYAQAANEITKQLKDSGVSVKYYGKDFEPKSRFTIIRFNTNPQVAIANTESSIKGKNSKRRFKHTIYETSKNGARQDMWISSLAIDLMMLLGLVSKDE